MIPENNKYVKNSSQSAYDRALIAIILFIFIMDPTENNTHRVLRDFNFVERPIAVCIRGLQRY